MGPLGSLNKRPHAVHTADTTSPGLQAQFGYYNFTSCLPVTIQFVDTSITNGNTITNWFWDFGDGTTGTDQEPIHDYLVDGNYTVSFTISDDSGHTSTTSMLLVISTNTPTVNLGPDTSVCQGSPLVLDAGVQPPDVQYYWSTGDTTRTITVTTTGDYYVQVYNASCSGFSQLHVSAKPELVLDFAHNQADTCLPVTMQFADLSQACGANIVYRRWDFDNGDSSNLQNPSYLYASGGSHTVTLTEMDDNGVQLTTTRTIYVNTNANLVNLGNDTVICYGAPITLDAGSLASHYTWNTGDTTRTISVKDGGIYGVQVSKNGCQGWDSITVMTFFPLAPAFSSDITSQCLPVAVHFTDNTKILCGSSPLTDWYWDFGDGSTGLGQAPTHVYRKAGPFTVKLTMRNSQGVTDSVSKNITIVTTGPDPVALGDATICLGHAVSFDAGNDGARYTWTPADVMSNDSIRNPSASPTVTTQIRVEVSKCGVTVVDSAMIYVDSVSRPVLQYDGSELMAQPAVTYQWYKDETAIAGATDRIYKPLAAGYYEVEISNTKGCYGRSPGYFFLPEGVSIPGSKMKVKVSPNPAGPGDMVNILFSKVPSQPVEVNLYDTFGRKVYGTTCSNVVNPIDCSRFYKGMYYVEVLTKGQKVVLPLQIL